MAWPIIKGTAVLKALNDEDEGKALLYAAEILKKGGLVAFPTETVYGLGGDALNPGTVQNIYKVKQRPPDNPLIIHVAGMDQAARLVEEVPPEAFLLAENFWPGPHNGYCLKRIWFPTLRLQLSSAATCSCASFGQKTYSCCRNSLAAPSATFRTSSPTTVEHLLMIWPRTAHFDGGSCSVA